DDVMGQALVDWYQRPDLFGDDLVVVVTLFYGPLADQLDVDLVVDLRARIDWGLRTKSGGPADSRRFGATAFRVAIREGWTVPLIHRACLLAPEAVLVDSRIPLADRKAAALMLADMHGAAVSSQDELSLVLADDVCRHEDGTPDLAVAAGVLRLNNGPNFALLTSVHTPASIAAGFWRDPIGSAGI